LIDSAQPTLDSGLTRITGTKSRAVSTLCQQIVDRVQPVKFGVSFVSFQSQLPAAAQNLSNFNSSRKAWPASRSWGKRKGMQKSVRTVVMGMLALLDPLSSRNTLQSAVGRGA
jgi:hypothetical protein